MNKPNTKCRVCGKEYFCCSDSKKINSWRTMACSPECYKEYMNRIEKSRKPTWETRNVVENNDTTDIPKVKSKKKIPVNPEKDSGNLIIEN